MELRQLRDFLAVVDCGTFSAAAEQLGKSQQAISKSVRALEASLGVRLLDRNPRAVTPTAFGRLLLPYGRNIHLEAAAFRDRLGGLRKADGGRVRLGASPASATHLVTEAVLSLRSQHPSLHVAVLSGIYATMARDLLAGELDLFVCIDNEDELVPGLTREILLHDEYHIVAAANHPLARQGRVPAVQLREFPWVIGRNLGEIELAWRRAFESAGLPAPDAALETTSVEFCKHALQSGQYLSVLPLQLIDTELEHGILRCVEADGFAWQRPVALHYRRHGTLDPAALAVIDALHRAGEKYQRIAGAA